MSVSARRVEPVTRPRRAESGGFGWTFALFVVGVLAYGAAFAWYLLDRLDLVNLIRDVNVDDSFYYFQIAWRMAQGEFSTFDGITRTNGYHPLWLFLITPFYQVFDKTGALFAIKAFEILLVAGGVALAAGAARAARLPWILLFAALPVLYRNPALFLGLEAAAGLFLLGLFLLAVCLFARDPVRWRWPLAAVAFALPWVRLEYVAVSVAATAALCLVEWPDRLPSALAESVPRAHRGGWSGRVRSVAALHAAAPLAGAVAGILAYFTYNGVVFGGAVPVSGAAKQWFSQSRWEEEGGYSLTENVRGFLLSGHFDFELLIALEVCAYAVLVWWFSRGREDRLLLAFLVGVSALAAGHLAKFAQSVLTVHPGSSVMTWYFVPAYLTGALAVPVRCYVAVWFVRRFLDPRLRRASRIPSLGIVTIGAVFLFATTDFTMPFRYGDSLRERTWPTGILFFRKGTTVMDRLLPEDAVAGALGAGVIGYFSRFPVVNLDGLVNSWDYLRAMGEGTEAAFHRRYGITHFVGTMRIPAAGQTALLFEGPSYQPPRQVRVRRRTPLRFRPGRIRRFKVLPVEWRRTAMERVDRSEWFWKRMAPHLEHQEDDVGLLVDGRLAQAFARDCASGLAVWTWAGQEGPVLRPWTKTSIGFCASEIVLPHDALRPVRVATMTASEYLADRIGGRRPAIDADFDVYPAGNRLVYVKKECGSEDVDAPFFLRVDPVDPDDLPGPRRPHGFDDLDFRFEAHGVVSGACVAEVPLPEYGIAALRTGQFAEGEFDLLWEIRRQLIRGLPFTWRQKDEFHPLWEGEIRFGLLDRLR